MDEEHIIFIIKLRFMLRRKHTASLLRKIKKLGIVRKTCQFLTVRSAFFISKTARFTEKSVGHETFVFFSSTTFVLNISISDKSVRKYTQNRVLASLRVVSVALIRL